MMVQYFYKQKQNYCITRACTKPLTDKAKSALLAGTTWEKSLFLCQEL